MGTACILGSFELDSVASWAVMHVLPALAFIDTCCSVELVSRPVGLLLALSPG